MSPTIHSLQDAPPVILFHVAVAVCAVVLGGALLLRRKGTFSHKVLGRVWIALMVAAALSSFAIQGRGRFSLIHALSIVVLVAAPVGVLLIRRGRVRAHRITMVAMFVSLCVTGMLTLLPYRMLGQAVFGR
jgi:uncharacterized membrane protein